MVGFAGKKFYGGIGINGTKGRSRFPVVSVATELNSVEQVVTYLRDIFFDNVLASIWTPIFCSKNFHFTKLWIQETIFRLYYDNSVNLAHCTNLNLHGVQLLDMWVNFSTYSCDK